MDIAKKRDFLMEFCCTNHDCPVCCLNDEKFNWSMVVDERNCPNIFEIDENELDKAIEIIGKSNDKNDPVNHPSHYTQGGIECIDAIKASMTDLEFRGFLKGQVIKYMWRYSLKGKPVEDLKKAEFYRKRLTEEIEKSEGQS